MQELAKVMASDPSEMEETDQLSAAAASDKIHHSIADADDIEEVWNETITVSGVFQNLLSHPGQIISRWNWKSAVLGAVLRSSFYFTVYQASGEKWLVVLTAVIVEFASRFITTGIAGAIVQSFRRATPFWLANLIVSVSLPAFSHTVEFIVHYAQERYLYDIFAASTDSVARRRTFAISVLFSVVSALFNLFAMKHGVLLVGAGEETQSLGSDIKKMPRMIGEFVAFLPVQISKYIEGGKILNALLYFSGFGVIVGAILGTARFKWQWAWRSASGAWAVLLFAVLVTLLARYISKRKGTMYRKRY